jgi:hypothetical protein
MEKGVRVNQKKLQDQAHACYVLITCGQPSAEGKMQVEMTYEGDPSLAAYLLQNAQDLIDPEEVS